MSVSFRTLSLTLAIAVGAVACQKSAAPAPPQPAAAGGAATPAVPMPPPVLAAPEPRQEADSPRLQSGIEVIAAYANVRAAFAADNLAGARKAAPAVAQKVRAAAAQWPATDKASCDALAAAADKVTAATEIEAARLEFGAMSKALLTLVAAEGSLQHGLIAYRCPMAKGYQKWVQTGDAMANPYMGAKMLQCGGKTPLVP